MCIYRRTEGGPFYMNFTVRGQRVFRSTGQVTKRAARQAEGTERQKLLDQVERPGNEDKASTLLGDAVEVVFEAKWKYGKDALRSYRRSARLVSLIGNIPLIEIDDKAVAGLIRTLEKSGSSVATLNRYLANLKTILKHFRLQTDHIRMRKERPGRIRTISSKEEVQIVNLLCETPHAARRSYFVDVADLVEVLIDTGMRLGEALALRYEDVDFGTSLISIWINKGDRPRSVAMTSRVRSILETRRDANDIKPFTLKAHQAETAWRWLRKTMGLEADKEFVLHALRHTCASRLIQRGVDLYVIRKILGHSSIKVTEKYAHLEPQTLTEAMSVLEAKPRKPT